MKILFLLLMPCLSFAQPKWNHVSKNDLSIMGIEVLAGYGQGWRDEINYHPNQLFKRFPNLNRNFWDIRVQNDPTFLNTEWDADHVFKFAVNGLHVAGIILKVGDLKSYPKKDRWKKILFDIVKYYGSYKLGFFLAWNVTNQNKL